MVYFHNLYKNGGSRFVVISMVVRYATGRLQSIGHALRGLASLLRDEPNAQIHGVATLLVIIVGVIFQLTPIEWGLIALAITGVWVAEALNTAIESVVDLISLERRPLAKRAKDIAAGATLLAACGSIAIALVVLVPHIVRLLG